MCVRMRMYVQTDHWGNANWFVFVSGGKKKKNDQPYKTADRCSSDRINRKKTAEK